LPRIVAVQWGLSTSRVVLPPGLSKRRGAAASHDTKTPLTPHSGAIRTRSPGAHPPGTVVAAFAKTSANSTFARLK